MPTAMMSSKGQITIPKGIRSELGLETGDRVSFTLDEDRVIRLVPITKDLSVLKGVVAKPAKAVSSKAMKATIAAKAGRL